MHDRHHDGAGKPVQSRPGASGPESERSRAGVGSNALHASKLGAGESIATGENSSTALADSVPQRPRLFNFDAQGVRVVGTAEAPWFVAKDVCAALGLGGDRVSDAVAVLEHDEKGSGIVATLGGPQAMLTVSESGLYALIFRSRKPQARVFRRWVTGEVLPAIRRTGGYAVPAPAALPAPALVRLPPPATIEHHLARILATVVAWPRVQGLVHPVEIARAATDLRLFHELCADPADPRQVSRLLRFMQGRGFLGRWLPLGEGSVVFCEALGRHRHRRYNITLRPASEKGGAA